MSRMLKSSKTQKNISFKTEYEKLPIEVESENISKILPNNLYKNVAKIVGLDENIKEKLSLAKRKDYKKLYKGIRYLSHALQVTDKEVSDEYDSDTPVEPPSPRLKSTATVVNPYLAFLKKTEREQVTWKSKYLPPETESEKGLIRRADDITNRICSEFCTYMHGLGGYDSPLFKQEAVKELFQIEFNNHATDSLRVIPSEVASVPTKLANFTKTPKLSYGSTLKRSIQRDVQAELRPDFKHSFGRQLPKNLQWKAPRNSTKKYWVMSDKLPKNITSMENVWGGITKLKSVQDFCKWIIDHPEYDRPSYLKKNGLFERNTLQKVSAKHKFDISNQLPKITFDKLVITKGDRKMSVPPDDIKMIYP